MLETLLMNYGTTVTHLLLNEAATENFAAHLARDIKPPLVIYLNGVLGAGKTTFVRGFLRALGFKDIVKSPTFTLVEPYLLPSMEIYHFDLYRLTSPEELAFIGVEDYCTEKAILLIEWPEKGVGFLPMPNISITFEIKPEGRMVSVQTGIEKGRGW